MLPLASGVNRNRIDLHLGTLASGGTSLEWRQGFLDALNARGVPQANWPQIQWLVDPNDYLRPLVFKLTE
jgi:hypothetical protein